MSGGGPNGDLSISAASLEQITRGLRAAINQLGEAGSSDTDKLLGSGFSELTMTHMEAGDSALTKEFDQFCGDWEWGVRALVQDANWLAATLGLAAGMHWEEDQYRATAFKTVANAASPTGNPYATEEDLAKQGYGDIFTPDAPDYSPESWQQGGKEASEAWKETGRSVTEDGIGGAGIDAVTGRDGGQD